MSTVVISPYSAAWPEFFTRVRAEILGAFAPLEVVVEHTGSTSVPGLPAKPVLDVLLGAGRLSEVESKIPALEGLGYSYVSKYERELPMRRYFVKAESALPRVHLHAVELGSPFWEEHLRFRDLLRTNPGLASRYAALKLRLAKEHALDKAAYTAAKAPFIQAVLSGESPESGDTLP